MLHGYGCTTHAVVPRRLDGTLNRGLVYVAHYTWTVKIPTVTEEENLGLPAHKNTLQTGKRKKVDERSTGAAGGHRDPHIEFSARSNKARNEMKSLLSPLSRTGAYRRTKIMGELRAPS